MQELYEKFLWTLFALKEGCCLNLLKAVDSSRLHLPSAAKAQATIFSEAPFKLAGGVFDIENIGFWGAAAFTSDIQYSGMHSVMVFEK